MRRFLVVGNQTLGSQQLHEAMQERLAAGPCEFHVVVPATPPREHVFWSDGEAHAVAQRRLDAALAEMQSGGANGGRRGRRREPDLGGRGCPPAGDGRRDHLVDVARSAVALDAAGSAPPPCQTHGPALVPCGCPAARIGGGTMSRVADVLRVKGEGAHGDTRHVGAARRAADASKERGLLRGVPRRSPARRSHHGTGHRGWARAPGGDAARDGCFDGHVARGAYLRAGGHGPICDGRDDTRTRASPARRRARRAARHHQHWRRRENVCR